MPGRRLGRWGLGTGGQGWLLQVVSHTGEYLSSFPGVLSMPVSSYRAGCLKASDFLFSFSPPTTSPSTIGHLNEAKWAQNAILNVGRTHYLMCPENKQGRTWVFSWRNSRLPGRFSGPTSSSTSPSAWQTPALGEPSREGHGGGVCVYVGGGGGIGPWLTNYILLSAPPPPHLHSSFSEPAMFANHQGSSEESEEFCGFHCPTIR